MKGGEQNSIGSHGGQGDRAAVVEFVVFPDGGSVIRAEVTAQPNKIAAKTIVMSFIVIDSIANGISWIIVAVD